MRKFRQSEMVTYLYISLLTQNKSYSDIKSYRKRSRR